LLFALLILDISVIASETLFIC